MITKENISVITVLNQGIVKKCSQCVSKALPGTNVEQCHKQTLDFISSCSKPECGLHSVRYQG